MDHSFMSVFCVSPGPVINATQTLLSVWNWALVLIQINNLRISSGCLFWRLVPTPQYRPSTDPPPCSSSSAASCLPMHTSASCCSLFWQLILNVSCCLLASLFMTICPPALWQPAVIESLSKIIKSWTKEKNSNESQITCSTKHPIINHNVHQLRH